jgi:hypothetical protein
MSAAPTIVLVAGTGTFANEWLQTGKPNWRVVPATLLGSWAFSGLDKISEKVALPLSIMVAIVAVTTTFNGKSIVQELNSALNTGGKALKSGRA